MTKNEFAKYVASRIKSVRVNPLTGRSLNNYDDILLACQDVYKSGIIFPRFGRLAKRKDLDVSSSLGELAKSLYNYFKTSISTPFDEAKFDVFHEKLCDDFLQSINEIRIAKGYAPLHYGSAQKMINMVFKYLACYKDYATYQDCFEHCHMPIDSKILCELKNTYSIPNVNCCFYAKICGGATFEGKSWTKFDKKSYGDLLKITRTTIAKNPKYIGKTLLEIEFEIWE